MSDIPGYDVPAVEAWIDEHIDSLQSPLTWRRLEGGHSNLTFELTDARGRMAVIRRPPMGELLPKAHDMWREYRIIEALGPTPVPVPEALGYEPDASVTGAHFYVMGHVPGRALFNETDAREWLDLEARRNVAGSYVDTLAALHSVDPGRVGLDDLGRHDGYVARQVRTWYGSWTASADAAEYDDPRLHELHHWLTANLPEQGPARIVHGDCGLHNHMFDQRGQVTAVLDWEIATLGDPIADFGYAVMSWAQPEDDPQVLRGAATLAEGFGPRQQLIDLYAEATGADLSNLDYYLAFNHFKASCIVHGVYARYKMGQKSTEGIDMDGLRARFIGSLEHAVRMVDTLS